MQKHNTDKPRRQAPETEKTKQTPPYTTAPGARDFKRHLSKNKQRVSAHKPRLKKTDALVELTLARFVRGAEVRSAREARGYSQRDLARALKRPRSRAHPQELVSFSSAYVARLELGQIRPSAAFVNSFREWRETFGTAPEPAPRVVHALMHYTLPEQCSEIEILARPVQCKGCKKWFIPRTPTQQTHTAPHCQTLARQAQRAKTKRAERSKTAHTGAKTKTAAAKRTAHTPKDRRK